MMLSFEESATISGDLAAVWRVATDVDAWSDWDPHFLGSHLDGPFQAGSAGWTILKGTPRKTKGPFTITSAEPQRSYTTESPLPMGMMVIVQTLEPAGADRVRLTRSVTVHGGFVPFFRLFFAKGMKKEIPETFHLLEGEVAKRAAGSPR